MVPLGDEALVEACFSPFGDSVILTQDRCTVCVERTIDSEILFDTPNGSPMGCGSCGISLLSRLETVLVSAQDRCTVCAKRAIGLEIVFDAPDGNPR